MESYECEADRPVGWAILPPSLGGLSENRWVLYGHPRSGHSYKVALALSLMGQGFEFRLVDLEAPREQRRGDWRRDSQFGEVPVLLHDGRPITQSNAILQHLQATLAPEAWRVEPDRNGEWLFWEANRIGFSFPNYRFVGRPGAGVDATLVSWLRECLVADLGRMEEELTVSAFLTGGRPAIADLSCAAYLLLDDGASDLAAWPAVRTWLERLRGLPGWRSPAELMSADGIVAPISA
jgi:glutathione S-transferase